MGLVIVMEYPFPCVSQIDHAHARHVQRNHACRVRPCQLITLFYIIAIVAITEIINSHLKCSLLINGNHKHLWQFSKLHVYTNITMIVLKMSQVAI